MKRAAWLLLLIAGYAWGSPYLDRDGDYVQIINPDNQLVWCWIDIEGGNYKTMWIQPGGASLWHFVGRSRYGWGCK